MNQTELSAKYLRIQKLAEMELNTPIMLPVNPQLFSFGTKTLIAEFLTKWGASNNKRFNIRTYSIDPLQFSKTHYLGVKRPEVLSIVEAEITKGNYCMIDNEDPENFKISGNILLRSRPTAQNPIIIEYCENRFGAALVREADTTEMYGSFADIPGKFDDIIKRLSDRFTIPYSEVIVEFSIARKPTGMRNEIYMFWEYRDLKEQL